MGKERKLCWGKLQINDLEMEFKKAVWKTSFRETVWKWISERRFGKELLMGFMGPRQLSGVKSVGLCHAEMHEGK